MLASRLEGNSLPTTVQLHSKTVDFTIDIQIAPYCKGASKGKREQDEFYVGTVQQICIIINNLTLDT